MTLYIGTVCISTCNSYGAYFAGESGIVRVGKTFMFLTLFKL